jgi:DNA-binding SARP family transcriptional activator/tetratricopeptide (TPR) repeat protein
VEEQMIFRLLGELEVRDPAGRVVELPSGHDRTVLAKLLVLANRQVPAADLIRAGWGSSGVDVAQLHKSISALRKLLVRAGRPGAIKTHNRFGYELRVAEDDMDVLVFRRLVDQADEERRRGHAGEEIRLHRRALQLWRGSEPLANVPAEPFGPAVEALKARRKRIAVRLFTIELDRGAHASVLDELQQFVAEDPTDGHLCRLLMVALHQAGHVVDALVAYDRHVAAVESATGGRPDPELRRLRYAMNSRPGEAAPSSRPAPVPRQLPAAPADFIGRSGSRDEAVALMRRPERPVVVVSGAGGMGKTALALRAAHDAIAAFPDGQLWAELRGTTEHPADPAEVLAQFLRALGAPVVPETRAERAALFRSMLAGRRMLVFLDDAATAAQVRDLVPGDPAVVVVITSRRRLPDIPGGATHVTPLEPLDHATASVLFRSLVDAAKVDLTGEDDDVDAVVRMCGGLPLALRIAAYARIESPHRPTADLRARLSEYGPDALEHEDVSLSRVLQAGLAAVSPAARRLFLRLGLLTGPTFAGWTATALLGDDGTPALHQLAAVSLVEPAGDSTHWRFHDLTREYAARRARAELDPGECAAAEIRVYRALLTLVRHAHAALYHGDAEIVHSDLPDVEVPAEARAETEAAPAAWFDGERANLRAAVQRAATLGAAALCWDLAVSAHEFYTLGDWFDDWRATHEVALFTARAAGDRRGEGVVLAMLGQPPLVASGGPGVSGVPELQRAVELLTEAGERHGRAIALRTLANALRRAGELARPLALFLDARADYEASGDAVGTLQTLRFIGQTYADRGEVGPAREMFRRAEQMARALDNPRVLAQTRYWVGRTALAAGDVDGAERAFEDVRAAFPAQTGLGHAYARHGLGDVARARGDLDGARRHLSTAETLAHEAADVILGGRVALSIADTEAGAGRVNALLRAAARFRACGAVHLEVAAQARLAAAYEQAGEPGPAAAAWDRIDLLYAAVPDEDRLVRR